MHTLMCVPSSKDFLEIIMWNLVLVMCPPFEVGLKNHLIPTLCCETITYTMFPCSDWFTGSDRMGVDWDSGYTGATRCWLHWLCGNSQETCAWATTRGQCLFQVLLCVDMFGYPTVFTHAPDVVAFLDCVNLFSDTSLNIRTFVFIGSLSFVFIGSLSVRLCRNISTNTCKSADWHSIMTMHVVYNYTVHYDIFRDVIW